MNNSTQKKLNIPIEKQQEFITEYENSRGQYVEYAQLLDKILNKAVSGLNMLAIVQARPKGVVSFTNKIISKDKYKNPLTDMTDLCGARVIVHFQSHVEKICGFIRDNFEIDEANSLDAKSRLQVNEFGYRSVHYIVTPKKDKILDIDIHDKFKKLKAEIQVRTIAEHVWADISHDRLYKTDLTVPDEWKREAARLAAVLENADREFAGMSAEIDSLTSVYELQNDAEKAETEILKLNTLISVIRNDADESIKNSLKLSAIYRDLDEFRKAVDLLRPKLDLKPKNIALSLKLQFEYGYVLALSEGAEIQSPAYTKGLKLIAKVLKEIDNLPAEVKHENRESLSYIYYRAGKLLLRNVEENSRPADLLTIAHNLMPENPLYLVALLESLILRNRDMAHFNISLFNTNIREAELKINELIEIGIKRVTALFAIGHCCLFLGDEAGCIRAYARAAGDILNKKYLLSRLTLQAEINLIGRLKTVNAVICEQIKLYLNLALTLLEKAETNTLNIDYIRNSRIATEPFKTPVVIVAGGSAKMDLGKVDEYRKYIEELIYGFRGTIISGGTNTGIPGLVGDVKSKMKKNTVGFNLVAYLPETLPADAIKSSGYDCFYETDSDRFSALDILVTWTDLVCNGIDPKDVILFGIDGGAVATMEYQIALSLGAKVALLAYSGRAASDFLKDNHWKNHPGLLQLPNDPLTVWALVNQNPLTLLTEEEVALLAPKAHEFYRQKELLSFKSTTEDINKYKVLMAWENLDKKLQNSNLKQVAFYGLLLERAGLSIRKAEQPVPAIISELVSTGEYEFMARMEHARWNAERLLEGWTFGPQKDISRKISPCLVAWDNLDDQTKSYDFDPVNNIPVLLQQIGYEVYKV
jgi:ppGpp synthetase/RelA/SpoT-type nucleotidyltranferase